MVESARVVFLFYFFWGACARGCVIAIDYFSVFPSAAAAAATAACVCVCVV